MASGSHRVILSAVSNYCGFFSSEVKCYTWREALQVLHLPYERPQRAATGAETSPISVHVALSVTGLVK